MLYCKCCIYEALFRNEILPCVYHRRLHLEMHYNFFGDTFHKSRHLGFHYDGKLCVSKVLSNLTLLCHIYHNSLLFCGGLILHAYKRIFIFRLTRSCLGPKKARSLAKNQHTQSKPLYLVNSTSDSSSKSAEN